ncbi:MAG: DUF1761 domain-containing protein [Salinibacterium sp.]|nr:MAG: DUF1761 domain-containing protein [Salinibacterium sp.]
MVPEINWWAVLAATASSMVVGSVWYARKVFGTRWMRLAKIDENAPSEGAVAAIIVTLFVSFITAAVLAGSAALAQNFYHGNFLVNCLVTAVVLWAGFSASRIITHDVFEGRPANLTILNLAHELVTVLVMALVIGLFGISAV